MVQHSEISSLFLADSSCGTCQGKADGSYPCRDTFTYLKCIAGTGSTVKCPTNQVYIHRERRCRRVTVADQCKEIIIAVLFVLLLFIFLLA